MSFTSLIHLLRVHQWVKNLFIISPLVFSGQFHNINLWSRCLLTIVSFCFISSGVYIINDIADLKEDQLHPKKAQRPLATGKITSFEAKCAAILAMVLGLVVSYLQGWNVVFLSLAYIILNIFYNYRIKHIVILDVLAVALGFQIRIWVGAAAVYVFPSYWLQICMFFLSLFLGFTKRRCEMSYLEENAVLHRAVLSKYTVYFLDQMIVLCATLSILLYVLYTFSTEVTQRFHNFYMFYSSGFVVYGIFRYLYLLYFKKIEDDPWRVLVSDVPMITNIILWLVYVVIVIQMSIN